MTSFDTQIQIEERIPHDCRFCDKPLGDEQVCGMHPACYDQFGEEMAEDEGPICGFGSPEDDARNIDEEIEAMWAQHQRVIQIPKGTGKP